ncbi:MAG: NIPSNAP family protein [Cyanobacteria bacterium P01_A01_bin.83]
MIFRLRQYKVAPGKIDVFNTFFRERLLPVQKRYGACLIGRWQTKNGNRVVALWVYDNIEQYESIQAKVRIDPDSIEAQKFRRAKLNSIIAETEEDFMVSTIPLDWTELSHLQES